MKTITRLLLSLSLCLAVPLSSCSTAGRAPDATMIARSAVQIAVMEQLGKAKTKSAWDAKHAQLTALVSVLKSVNTGGLSIETVRPLLAAKLADKPYAMLLLDLVLVNAAPAGAGGAVNNAILAAITDGIESALALPAPSFAS